MQGQDIGAILTQKGLAPDTTRGHMTRTPVHISKNAQMDDWMKTSWQHFMLTTILQTTDALKEKKITKKKFNSLYAVHDRQAFANSRNVDLLVQQVVPSNQNLCCLQW